MFASLLFVFSKIIERVACPKFGHPALSSEFYNHAPNTEFVAAVGMLRKKLNHCII